MTKIVPGADYPILVCMSCGGTLEKGMGGYVCVECGELHSLEEAGLGGVEITSQEKPEKVHVCPDCGSDKVGITHNIADEAVRFCDDCGAEWPYE